MRRAFSSGLLAVVAAGFALAVSVSSSFAYEDHVVAPGETLSSIAAAYGFPVDTLAEVNGLSSADAIYVGQVIRIPGRDAEPTGGGVVATASGGTHVVEAGETLTGIANQSGIELGRWIALNGLGNANAIYVGQVLQIPAGGTAAAAPGGPLPDTFGLVASGKTHTIAVGDTLSAIADQYGVPLAMWVELNHLLSPDAIYVGEVLEVPGTPSAPGPGPTTPSTGAVPSGRRHTVQAGETLSFIADHYNIPLASWVQTNHLKSADSVFVGQQLDIPAAAGPVQQATFTHVVKAGESLAGIAATYGISLDEITRLNGITNANLVTIGQVLAVPGPVCRPGSKEQYRIALENAAAEYGISISVVLGLSWHESGWQQCIVSHANAFGLMQVTPGTAQWALDLGLTDAADYQVNYIANARMGAAILRDHLFEAHWDLRTALAAYYQGFEALYAVGMYEETRVYISQVLSAIALYE